MSTRRRRRRTTEPLTDAQVRELELPKRKAHRLQTDGLPKGLYARIYAGGTRTFMCVGPRPNGKPKWSAIGPVEDMTIEAAAAEARSRIARIKLGLPPETPAPTRPNTLREVAADWMKREGKDQLRRAEKQRRLDVCLLPVLGDTVFTEITKLDLAVLLDDIEDKRGPRMADMVKVDLQAIAKWYASRTDYTNPFRDLPRRSTAAPRERILDQHDHDDAHCELRAVWAAAGLPEAQPFGSLVKLALLTAQRREKLLSMRWDDVDLETGRWTIPHRAGEKGVPPVLILPPAARVVLAALPRLSDTWVFPARHGPGHVVSASTLKCSFDKLIEPAIEPYTVHDLRRTSRSAMSEAGVPYEIAERIMGHKLAGVGGIYDRSKQIAQMAAGLATLAAYIENIVNEAPGKVVPLRRPASP
jgi:integrase